MRLNIDDVEFAERHAAIIAGGRETRKPLYRERNVPPELRAYAALTTNAARGAIRDVN